MKPGQVRALIDKYEALLKAHERMAKAVEYSKTPQATMELRIRKRGDQGSEQYPIEFNLELGQALYEGKLQQYENELKEIKRRIHAWT